MSHIDTQEVQDRADQLLTDVKAILDENKELRAAVKHALAFLGAYRRLMPTIQEVLDADEEEHADEVQFVDSLENKFRAALSGSSKS